MVTKEWVYKLTAQKLLDELLLFLEEAGYSKISRQEDYLYTPGDIPILMVAHVDTVHFESPREIFHDKEKGVLWSPQGIGGDDRAGVAGILELINRGYKPYVLFTDGEETGGIGASAAAKTITLSKRIKYIIELDRKNGNDAVFYSCDNPDFTEYILQFGFKEAYGSFSDISILCPAWGVAGVNLSCGYYNAHRETEYVRVEEWNKVLLRVEKMLNNLPHKRFKYKARVYKTDVSRKKLSKPAWYSYSDLLSDIDNYSYLSKREEEEEEDYLDDYVLEVSVSPETLSDIYGGSASDWNKWLRDNYQDLDSLMYSMIWDTLDNYVIENPYSLLNNY